MSRAAPSDCVGDFVEDGFANQPFLVQLHEVPGQTDFLFSVVTQPVAGFRAVELESPVGEVVIFHEVTSHLGSYFEIHRCAFHPVSLYNDSTRSDGLASQGVR